MRLSLKRKAITGTPEVAGALANGWTAVPLLGGGARQRILDAYATAQTAEYAWLYQRSPAVRTCIDVLVRNIGQLELRLYEEVDQADRQPRPDHPAAVSLRYPNETTTADSLVRQLFKDYLILDNAYAVVSPAAGNQISLNWVPGHLMEIRGSSMFTADVYRFWRPEGWGYVDFAPDQILHWRGENPRDPRVGLSRLETLRGVIAEDVALQQAMVELASAGLQAPTWAFRPADAPQWSNEARKGFEEDLTNRLKRRNRQPVVLEEGMELRSFGVSPMDAQMMEVRRWVLAQIATSYGLPLGMVGLENDIAAAQSQFYTDTLPPYCENFTRMLNQRVLVRIYDWTDGAFEFNLDKKLMGDDRLRTLTSASGRPILLTNEARAMVNRPPVEGGDELVTPLNVIVGSNPKPSVDVMGPQDPNGVPQDGSGREQDQLPDGQPPKALVKAGTLPRFHPGRVAEIERQARNVDRMKGVVQTHYNRLERDLRQKAGTDWDRLDRLLTQDVKGALGRIVETEGGIYAMKLGGGNFNMDQVRNYVKAMAQSAAGAINDVIRSEVADIGVDGALARAPQHVESAGTSLGVRSTVWTREEAGRQTGGNRVKTWVADSDRHAQFDGQTIELDADWPGGFGPGSQAGCACTATIT